ncbi:acetyltransferase [Kocuria varians]|uniref:Acetyltransferase n=1 Tax=Kocuria varians TaxID=1272 RepID=A0A4Y4D6Z2_KOCVA|nr:DapH/DapD/GlmU-related protein [Kocuria varians]GEC99067.1 acetyltransferase [Kocuria varians]
MTTDARTPDLDDLLTALNAGETIRGGSPLHAVMHECSQEALAVTAELNASYHSPEEVRSLLSHLSGRAVPETTTLFPPFRTDFGKNTVFGERVFVNSGCTFQDQGGITIGDDCLIGHNALLATLNHGMDPVHRADMEPAPIVLGRGVWLGSNVTVLPGVTIGDGAVVAAASVVTKDVPANTVVAGSPARVVRDVV